jgi:hypothetical protein
MPAYGRCCAPKRPQKSDEGGRMEAKPGQCTQVTQPAQGTQPALDEAAQK